VEIGHEVRIGVLDGPRGIGRVAAIEDGAVGLRCTLEAEVPVRICVSVGLLDQAKAQRLKDAGVDRLNHNLNTSERRYPEICTTHTYADRIATLRAARAAGLEQCSGLIAGMGEEDSDLVEVALALRALEVPSIPVNFLLPIAGNPLQSDGSLTPERALRVLAMMRLANPRAEVRIAAGREGHLRSLEALSLWPANSLFVEGYLTTKGKGATDTYRMIRDAGFEVEGPEGERIPLPAARDQEAFFGRASLHHCSLTYSVTLRPQKVRPRELSTPSRRLRDEGPGGQTNRRRRRQAGSPELGRRPR
jgi:hypothetical protein